MSKVIGFKNGNFDVNMSSLQGYIRTTYADLVACFGEPQGSYDDYKQDVCWDIQFADGVVVTIYNWKNGKNYCGEDGLDVEDITEWHIGGYRGTGAVSRVEECLDAYLKRTCYQEPKEIEYFGA